MNGILVTGTDTGVGKTIVCGLLAGFLHERGWQVTTQKPVQTGCAERPEDLDVHSRLMGERPAEPGTDTMRLRCPYLFRLPASPHLAAAQEGTEVDPSVIGNAFENLASNHDIVLMEGAGGVLVPLTEDLLIGDLAAHLGLAALVVVHNTLGCINHSLLTVEALEIRNIPIVGLVFNSTARQDPDAIQRDNPRIITRASGVPLLGEFPFVKNPLEHRQEFEPIGEAFLRSWKGLQRHE